MATGGAVQQGRLALPSAGSVLPRAEVERRFKTARPGEKIVWASGAEMPRGETSAYVARLYHEGLAYLFQPRSDAGFDFIVQKRHSIAAAARAEAEEPDEATDEILRALKRAANLDQRCPSNVELARIAGLATRDMAAWRITKLVKSGTIRIETVDAGREAGYRTVTIVETKKSTLLPPSLRQVAKSVRAIGGTGRQRVRPKRIWE